MGVIQQTVALYLLVFISFLFSYSLYFCFSCLYPRFATLSFVILFRVTQFSTPAESIPSRSFQIAKAMII